VRGGACTHNPAIEMLVGSFHGPLLMSLKEAQSAEPLMGHRGAREHLEFVHAVRRRDVAAAESIMRTHVERTAGRVKQ
jgi:GntR family transcriptional repressor for pyruvate dehydrogenase complex